MDRFVTGSGKLSVVSGKGSQVKNLSKNSFQQDSTAPIVFGNGFH
jgi:hypothetical protein